MRARAATLACAVVLVSLPAVAQTTGTASDSTQAGQPGFIGRTEIVAIADGYYEYSENGLPQIELRNFDTRDQLASVSMVKIGLSNVPSAQGRFGFRVDFHGGPAASLIHAGEPGQSGALRYVEQAFVSYLAPLGKGLQVDAGQFVTQHGAEVIEAKDDWNYSRSLLFALAIPYYHFGVRATYAFGDKVSIMGTVVNGWNDVVDNNGAKTFGVQASVKPAARLSLVQNYMAGPEQPGNTRDWRQLSDTVATYTLTRKLDLMANYDYGRDTVAGVPVHWQGIAGYARYRPSLRFAVSPRVEWYDDANGFTTGRPQALREVTMTGEVNLSRGFMSRVEFRRDWSDAPSFATASGTRLPHQATFAFALLYAFSSR